MKLVIAIVRPAKVDDVTAALEKLNLPGLTVTEVRGHGRQKGHTATYRGAEYDVKLLPKAMIKTAVPSELVEPAVQAITVEPAPVKSAMGACSRSRSRAARTSAPARPTSRRRPSIPAPLPRAGLLHRAGRGRARRPGAARPRRTPIAPADAVRPGRHEGWIMAGSTPWPHTPLVLCAVDFSPSSADIVRHAVACAGGPRPDGDSRAALTLLHVVEPLLVQAAAMTVDADAIQGECRQALAALASSVTSTALAQPATIDVRVGLPHVEILKTAADVQASLVVLGTQGQTGAARLFFGSTTQRVLRETGTPTLGVPPAANTIVREDAAGPALAIAHVIAALDFSDTTAATAQGAAGLAARAGARLTLAHVVPQARGSSGGPRSSRSTKRSASREPARNWRCSRVRCRRRCRTCGRPHCGASLNACSPPSPASSRTACS